MREYFDRYMRDEDHLLTTMYYVEQNPVDAGMVERAELWPWSSARHRTAMLELSKPAPKA
jgi:hypothetical protein